MKPKQLLIIKMKNDERMTDECLVDDIVSPFQNEIVYFFFHLQKKKLANFCIIVNDSHSTVEKVNLRLESKKLN